jgi:hypothetical protein
MYILPPGFVDGIPDTSHHNKITIDPALGTWPALWNKCTQGNNFVDSTFYHRAQDVINAQKLFGAYLFLTGDNINDQTALFFTTIMHALGTIKDPKLKLFLDFESHPINQCSLRQCEQAVLLVKQVTGKYPCLYMGRYQISVPSPILTLCDNCLPEYGTNPISPPGFTAFGTPRQVGVGATMMWQHTDGHNGAPPRMTPGIGYCDMSAFAGDLTALSLWWAT